MTATGHRVTRDELRTEIETGTVTVIDALPGSSWAQQHLPGGYRNVRKYRDGIQDWVDAGLPTERLHR